MSVIKHVQQLGPCTSSLPVSDKDVRKYEVPQLNSFLVLVLLQSEFVGKEIKEKVRLQQKPIQENYRNPSERNIWGGNQGKYSTAAETYSGK